MTHAIPPHSRRSPFFAPLLFLPAAAALLLLVAACGVKEKGQPAGAGGKEKAPATGTSSTPAVRSWSAAGGPAAALGTQAHRDEVMRSGYCAKCHPAIYAEHEENTHGRAFTDREARIATRLMGREDCVRCHTPRPIFQDGVGMTPIRGYHNLDEGNTCMTCHFKPGYDYSRFVGGPQCKTAFDPKTNTVQACATCHRIADTPEQWYHAKNGRLHGKKCMDCHMPMVRRPIAVGRKPTLVHSHLFPASDNEHQLRRAYTYSAKIEGNEVVVSITNSGAGHNFNTANPQRSIQSLVIVRDVHGKEIYRSRTLFGHGVAHPGLIEHKVLRMPHNSQIPSGATRVLRIPLKVSAGTAECLLFFKRYHPAPDYAHELSVLLEDRKLVFQGVTPSSKPVVAESNGPPTDNPPPETSPAQAADVNGFAKFAYPKPGTKVVKIPKGDSQADIDQLIALFEYPVPYAKVRAIQRLEEIGAPAIPSLIKALGYWDNESFNRAMIVLEHIGKPAVPALVAALDSKELYVRHHARKVLADLGFPEDRARIEKKLIEGLTMKNPVDRWSSAVALGRFGDRKVAPHLIPLLKDEDWDAATAAATSLAELKAKSAIPAIRDALHRAPYIESRRDLAAALAALGSPAGIPALIAGLRYRDPVIRQSCFVDLFDYTGMYEGYDPTDSEFLRRRGIRKIQDLWARKGGANLLREPRVPPENIGKKANDLVDELGGGTDTMPGGDDRKIIAELENMGDFAVPALVRGLMGFPSGFAKKRLLICQVLGELQNRNAAPYLAWTLKDRFLSVAGWACWALERSGDEAAIPAVKRWGARLRELAADHEIPKDDQPVDRLLAQAARTRLVLGDRTAKDELIGFLLSNDLYTRRLAIRGLSKVYGITHGYEPDAPLAERRKAYALWQGDLEQK